VLCVLTDVAERRCGQGYAACGARAARRPIAALQQGRWRTLTCNRARGVRAPARWSCGADVAPLVQVFYMFGAGGLVWAAGWEAMMGGIKASDPATARLLEGEDDNPEYKVRAARAGAAAVPEGLPWRAMLRSTPVRALAYTHFCNNWCAAVGAAVGLLCEHRRSMAAKLTGLIYRTLHATLCLSFCSCPVCCS